MIKSTLFFERLLQFLLFFISIFGGTLFNQLQIGLELFVIIILLNIIKWKLTIVQWAIFFIFIFISIVSFFQNQFFGFLINFKIFFIPLLLLLYYKNRVVDVMVITIFFFVNLFLILYQVIFNKYIVDVSGIINLSFQNEIENRPLGLFLNFHFSAFFTAICLLYYLFFNNRFVKVISSLLVAISGSFFTLFSFVLAFVNKYILLVGSIIFISFYLTFSINDYLFNFSKAGSLIVILYQFFDIDRYSVLSFFPQEYSVINTNWHNVVNYDSYSNNRILLENEMNFFTYLIQGGYFYATIFLFYYLKSIPAFAIFILIAMLHYGYALNPLIVSITIIFQNNIYYKSKFIYGQN